MSSPIISNEDKQKIIARHGAYRQYGPMSPDDVKIGDAMFGGHFVSLWGRISDTLEKDEKKTKESHDQPSK